MKKYSQVIMSLTTRTCVLGLAYMYLWQGDSGAGNILKFFLWFTFLANALLAMFKETRQCMRKQGRVLPAWMGELFGYVLATALVYHAHFVYATMAIMIPILSAVIYGSSPKESSNA